MRKRDAHALQVGEDACARFAAWYADDDDDDEDGTGDRHAAKQHKTGALLDPERTKSPLVPPHPSKDAHEREEVEWYDHDESDCGPEEEEEDERPPPRAINIHDKLWSRPALASPSVDEEFVFQHVDTTYSVRPGSKVPVIRVWGCTRAGQSVLVEIDDFKPYFYAEIPPEAGPVHAVRSKIEQYLRVNDRSRKKLHAYVLNVVPERKRTIRGYHRDAPPSDMYRFVMAQPGLVAKARDALEFANKAVVPTRCATYEANVPFVLRFMVDAKLGGCQWIRLPPRAYRAVGARQRASTCQVELRCGWGQLEPIDANTDAGGLLAPMRVLSFDIEVYRAENGFPKAEDGNPVITVCAALSVIGEGIKHRAVFTTAPPGQGCAPVPGATMFVCGDESRLLRSYAQYVREADPDIFTGWNIDGFDWPYLFKRAEMLDIEEDFCCITRIRGRKARVREKTFNSKAHGSRKDYELMCAGRFDYDGLTFMLRGQMTKYRSYKLNAISKEILNDSKVDVAYDQIPVLYDGSDEDRGRLAAYCLQDSVLPLNLLDKLMAFVNGVEQARVTGVPLKWLLSRGQGVRTFSNLLRYKLDDEVVPSKNEDSNSEATVGGHVEEPIRGYYEVPIATLDFASLYPSIMIGIISLRPICFFV